MKRQVTMAKYTKALLEQLKALHLKLASGTSLKTLQNASKELLLKMPKYFFFKAIEIKSYYENPDKDLDSCFPGHTFFNENPEFKGKIYEYLFSNIKI